MQYSVNAAGFEGHQLVVQVTGSLVTVPKLMIDEQPAPERLKRGQFLLRRNDGTEVVAEFRYTFFDPIPRVIIDGKTIRIVEPLKWYQWVWAGLPILLTFIDFDNFLSGMSLGGLAAMINTRVFRSEMSSLAQYAATATISIGAVVIYFILAFILVQ